ncbi:MAG TPA: phage tail sheath subtilisin-like domain-containing protein [Roseiflexaceae bacterium]|nr:phage tail sheath subtilisin-like domain-containing protein [Roseiflexaceae bacterium]
MSPQYLSPGVYIEEVERGSKPIEAAGTAVAAFIGFTEKRPEINRGQPHLVTSWTQYTNDFGGFVPGAFLPHAVYGYFLNGGGICYIQSLMSTEETAVKPSGNGHAPAKAMLPARGAGLGPALEVLSQSGKQVTVTVADPDAPGTDDLFKVTVRSGSAEEVFDNLSFSRAKGARNVTEVINRESKLVKIKELDSTAPLAERRPALGSYTVEQAKAETTALVSANSFEGSLVERSGLAGLEAIENITMVAIPDLMAGYLSGNLSRDDVKAVQLAVMAHCEQMRDRFAILDPLPNLNAQQINDWRTKEANYDSKYAALYYPWITVSNPLAKSGGPALISIPPSGHLAGLYARVDAERGVHKAPANEILRGVINLELQVTKGEQDILNPNGINCIRSFPGRGIRVWGARTLSSDASWRYINVRRLFCMIEESIYEGTQWVVFEPNDMDLWERVKRTITAFLTRVWRDGALFGATPGEAFYVKCDADLNPAEVRDAGQLIVEVGLAPVKPAEFVVFRFSQMSGGGGVSE